MIPKGSYIKDFAATRVWHRRARRPRKMGLQHFQAVMADFAAEYIKPMVEAKQAGSELERTTDKAFRDIFFGYTEITATLDAIDLVEILISVSPPRSKRVIKDDYIKFLVGSHLHEIYMLEQRMTAYATKISRLYKNADLSSMVKAIVHEVTRKFVH